MQVLKIGIGNGWFFEAHSPNVCCLCGSTDRLSGEHKIKASLLRKEFGSSTMMIGGSDPGDVKKIAQSAKSKHFHFEAPMCAECNGARTQAADREFERLHQIAIRLLLEDKDPSAAFQEARYAIGSAAYLDCFRYFAKLLCCHMADIGAPRPVHMSRFAMGLNDQNCVCLQIDRDWEFPRLAREWGVSQYAAHGGLIIYGNRDSGEASAFHSTLTIGPMRYVFHFRLNPFERAALRLAHRPFYEWCKSRVLDTEQRKIPDEKWLKLGLGSRPE